MSQENINLQVQRFVAEYNRTGKLKPFANQKLNMVPCCYCNGSGIRIVGKASMICNRCDTFKIDGEVVRGLMYDKNNGYQGAF